MRSGRWEAVAASVPRGRPMTSSSASSTSAPALEWLTEATRLLERLAATQADAIEQASRWCAEAIAAGGLVHLFGTGHSRIPVEEMFPRYGSYPGFNPMVELSMTFHTQVVGSNGQRQAMFIERMPGLAEVILSNFTFGPHDLLMVFSASGLSAVPVEMARGARQRGIRVIGVTSVAQSHVGSARSERRQPSHGRGRPRHRPLHARTPTHSVRSTASTPRSGPGRSITAIAIVNAIKVRTAHLLVEQGAMPPVITRASVVGAERSRILFDAAYREHARRIAGTMAGEG